MKKVLTLLLISLISLTCVFAEDPATTPSPTTQRMTIVSEVGQIQPKFILQGSLTNTNDFVDASFTDTQFAGTELSSELSIADDDIVAYFQVIQSGSEGGYARYKNVVTFEISVGDLTEQNPINNRQAKTVAGSLLDLATSSEINKYDNDAHVNQIALSKTAAALVATYSGRVNDDQLIGTFIAKWAQDPTVPEGTYKADVTITYTVN